MKKGKKPKYIEDLGHGSTSHAAPIGISDCSGHGFVLKADRKRVQTFVDSQLNKVAPGKVNYRAFPVVLHCYLSSPKAYSVAEDVGYVKETESVFLLLLLELRAWKFPRLVFWAPYMFIDSPGCMTTGREVWGFRKAMARIELTSADSAPVFSVRTQVFKTFDPNREAENDFPLIKVIGGHDAAVGPNVWSDFETARRSVGQRISELWAKEEGLLKGVPLKGQLGKMAVQLRKELPPMAKLLQHFSTGKPKVLPTVNLKQFRDVADSTRACYQALVDTPSTLSDLEGGGFLKGDYELLINSAASFEIVKDLGLTPSQPASEGPARIPVLFGFWAKLGLFGGPHGTVIWEA